MNRFIVEKNSDTTEISMQFYAAFNKNNEIKINRDFNLPLYVAVAREILIGFTFIFSRQIRIIVSDLKIIYFQSGLFISFSILFVS